ncbi:MAG: VOC family protein [Actinomycetota bacterium]
MWIRLRQIALVAADLRAAAADIGTVLGVEACFTDPGVRQFGLKNMLWPVGTQFLEVVTPIAEGTAGGRYLERRGGDGGYMVITQVDDITRRRARADELGIRVAFDLAFPDQGHDGIQLHPADTGGTFFEMDQMTMDGGDEVGGPWHPAGKNWEPYVRTDRVSAITAAEIQSPEPEPLARRWADMAEIDLETDADGNLAFPLENATIRFVEATDGRGEGLGAIDVAVTDRAAVLAGARARDRYHDDDRVDVAGLRVNLVDPPADGSGR